MTQKNVKSFTNVTEISKEKSERLNTIKKSENLTGG